MNQAMAKKKVAKEVKAPEMEVLSDAASDESSTNKSLEDTKAIAIVDDTDPTISALKSLTDLLENPQDFLHTILLPPSDSDGSSSIDDEGGMDKIAAGQCDTLRSVSKTLFSRLEKLANMMERVDQKRTLGSSTANDDDDEEEDDSPLSGLSELYTGESNDSDDDNDALMPIDAETVWGQVDIQNAALLSTLTKSIRKLSKRTDNTEADGDYQIRLLNMESIGEEDNDSAEETRSNSEAGSEDDVNEVAEGSDIDGDSLDEDEDEDAKRIRERMERAMAEMDDSEDEDEDAEEKGDDDDAESEGSVEVVVDPSREEMNDGFFDLHEMEAFADEEEEMLPDEAFGEPEADNEQSMEDRKKNLPHIRGRAGREGDKEEDEEFNALESKFESSVRRKKYREDEDIDALATLYDETNDSGDDYEDDSENDEIDTVNMSAADFFGQPRKPSKAFLEKLRNNDKSKSSDIDGNHSDADSWDDHDFQSGSAAWRDEGKKENDDEDEAGEAERVESEDEERTDIAGAVDKKLSAQAEREKKLNALTEDLEKETLAEKPWNMIGEATSKKRPENSLLESTPAFEFATKMAPIITEAHTESIEEVIKQRILAEDWDDVVPRELPDIGLDKRKGELPEVSQEKSKLSLGELYEREYLKKATGYDKDAVEKETEEEKARNEMKMLFANLCSKLDALSNYHFAPRPVADEADVRTMSTPAFAMEEVLPLHVSDANALAPEEIYGKKKGRDGILRGESEVDKVRQVSHHHSTINISFFFS